MQWSDPLLTEDTRLARIILSLVHTSPRAMDVNFERGSLHAVVPYYLTHMIGPRLLLSVYWKRTLSLKFRPGTVRRLLTKTPVQPDVSVGTNLPNSIGGSGQFISERDWNGGVGAISIHLRSRHRHTRYTHMSLSRPCGLE